MAIPLPTESLALQWRQYLTAIPYMIALQQFNQIGSHDISRPLRVTEGDHDLVRAGTALLMGFPGTPCIYYGDEVGLDGGTRSRQSSLYALGRILYGIKSCAPSIKQVIAIRRESDALKNGGFQLLYAAGDLIAFQRQSRAEQMIVVVYRGAGGSAAVQLDMALANVADGGRLTDLLTGRSYLVSDGSLGLENLDHGHALFLRVE